MGIRRLSLLGGEPSLHPNLDRVIAKARAAGFEQITMTTNGVMTREGLRGILAAALDNVSFSVDGSTAAIHDAIPPSASGKSTYDITMARLRDALAWRTEFGHSVTVNHTIFAANLHDVEAMVRRVASVGVQRVRLHYTMPGDHGPKIAPQDWVRTVKPIRELGAALGVEIQGPPAYGQEAARSACAGRSPYLEVQPDGALLLCSAHARLASPESRPFGWLAGDARIRLNPRSVIFDQTLPDTCCKGVPAFLREASEETRAAIADIGGMGCVLVKSSIAR